MRKLIINLLATAISLFVTAYLIQGFRIDPNWSTYLVASIVFLLLNAIVAPVVKLLLLPLNLLTLGLFRWVTSVLMLYVFDLLYGGVTISAYRFPGYESSLLRLPAGDLNLFWTLVLCSLTMSVTYGLVTSLLHTEE